MKAFLARLLFRRSERQTILDFLKVSDPDKKKEILDVGCGYGRYLQAMIGDGYHAIGVEVNEQTVAENIKNSIPCTSLREFENSTKLYDILLMAHIVEHFAPTDLLAWMEQYLARLKPGGHLIVVTPLLSHYFYEDFDHIKPFNPTGFSMVFCRQDSQVQYHSKTRLELRDIWFRRSPWRITFFRRAYVRSGSRWPLVVNVLFNILFHITGGVMGNTDGWVGLYKKI